MGLDLKMKIAVIPARGGSKRIPRKNVKYFCDKPIIAWSIDAAVASGCFDRIIVSTDDLEIADVARAHGAEVPFLRPPELSGDYAGTIPVVGHAIKWLIDTGCSPTLVCCLYATAPFVRSEDLINGLRVIENQACDYAFSVTTYDFPIQRSIKLDGNGRVAMFNPEHFNTRSQDLEEAYHDAGQFYWGTADAWLAGRQVFTSQSASVLLPRYRVQDIDTMEDWIRAEWMFKALNSI